MWPEIAEGRDDMVFGSVLFGLVCDGHGDASKADVVCEREVGEAKRS